MAGVLRRGLLPEADVVLALGAEHPRILADAPRAVGDHKSIGACRAAGQAAGHDRVAAALGRGKATQDRMPGFQFAGDKGGGGGKDDLFPANKGQGLLADALPPLGQFPLAQLAAHH